MGLRAIFYFLVKNPDCYVRLQAEIDAAFKTRKVSPIVTYQQGADLSYL